MNKENFENILNDCLERLMKGETVESCLEKYREQAKELEPLLRTACEARQLCAVQPRPEFKERARFQFRNMMAEKFREPAPKPWHWYHVWQRAWVSVLTAVVVIVILGGSAVAASANSMPDETLYSVKLAAEKVREIATFSTLDKAELQAEFADKRVTEIVYLAKQQDASKVEETTVRLNEHLNNITVLAGGEKLAAVTFNATDSVERSQMPALAPVPSKSMIGSPEPPMVGAITPSGPVTAPAPAPTTTSPGISATPVPTPIPTPAPAPDDMVPPQGAPFITREMATTAIDTKNLSKQAIEKEKLKQKVIRYAVNNSARINEALKNAPPELRPVLKKTIEESLAGYENAINSIDSLKVD